MLRDSQRLLPVRVFATLYFLSLFWAVLFLLIKKKKQLAERQQRVTPTPASSASCLAESLDRIVSPRAQCGLGQC